MPDLHTLSPWIKFFKHFISLWNTVTWHTLFSLFTCKSAFSVWRPDPYLQKIHRSSPKIQKDLDDFLFSPAIPRSVWQHRVTPLFDLEVAGPELLHSLDLLPLRSPGNPLKPRDSCDLPWWFQISSSVVLLQPQSPFHPLSLSYSIHEITKVSTQRKRPSSLMIQIPVLDARRILQKS